MAFLCAIKIDGIRFPKRVAYLLAHVEIINSFFFNGVPHVRVLGVLHNTSKSKTSMNNVKANKKPSNIVLLKRIAFSRSRQPAWQLQSQNFQSFSQQFHPQTYSGLKCVPITWWMKCPTLFGKLQRAILDLHQKEGTHSCSICNVYLWFSITSGCGEINCCSLLCFKTPMETLQISFYPLFFFFFFPFWLKCGLKKEKVPVD